MTSPIVAGTQTALLNNNTVFSNGIILIETDTGNKKIADGIHTYLQLAYNTTVIPIDQQIINIISSYGLNNDGTFKGFTNNSLAPNLSSSGVTTIFDGLIFLDEQLGYLANLNTNANDSLVNAVNEVFALANGTGGVSGTIGPLVNLTTSNKTTLVDAVNAEVNRAIDVENNLNSALTIIGSQTGNLLFLNTINKATLVAAINEVLTISLNASAFTSGTVSPARLPLPTGSTIGAVKASSAAAHQFATGITAAGVVTYAQPGATDISGLGTMATQNANSVAITGGTVTGLPAAVNPSDATSLSQVQSLIATGVHTYSSVAAEFSTNVVIATPGVLTDGAYTVATNDHILLIGQTTGSQNGPWIYNGSSSALTRPLEYSSGSALTAGIVYSITGTGSSHQYYQYVLNTASVTVDSTATTWGVFSSTIVGSGNITVNGGVVSITANPTFSAPSMNTATPGTNTTQGANCQFVNAAVLVETNRAQTAEQANLTNIGSLSSLTTSNKTSLVSALNEVIVDAANASFLTAGTVSGARLPPPTTVTFGAVLASTASSHQFATGINSSGVITYAQPAAADISGLGTLATQNANAVNIIGGSITGITTAVNPSDAVPLSQVQSLIATGIHTYLSVAALFSSNISITTPGTLNDGTYTVQTGDHILLINQTSGSQNGPWVYNGATVALSRPSDYSSGASVTSGFVYAVTGSGSTHQYYQYVLNTSNATVDLTATAWGVFQASIGGSAPISVTGGIVSLNNNGVTNGFLAQMPAYTIKGNITSSNANPTDITPAQMLNLLGGTTGTGAIVLTTNAALVTPNLGTPSAVNLTNAAGLTFGLVNTALSSATLLIQSPGSSTWS